MKYFDWSGDKNEYLKKERGVSFEEVLVAVEAGDVLDIVRHPNRRKYPRQYVFVVKLGDYAYLVPFVEDDEKVFLKTIIPSRKAAKKYLNLK